MDDFVCGIFRSSVSEVLRKILVLNIFPNSNKMSLVRPQSCNFIKKEILTQVFPCEFCEISKNTLSYRTHPVAASVFKRFLSTCEWLLLAVLTIRYCFSMIRTPLIPIGCSFKKIRSQKNISCKEKDPINKVECFTENDNREV